MSFADRNNANFDPETGDRRLANDVTDDDVSLAMSQPNFGSEASFRSPTSGKTLEELMADMEKAIAQVSRLASPVPPGQTVNVNLNQPVPSSPAMATGAPAAAFPTNFADSPAVAYDGLLNYKNKGDAAIYKAAVAELPTKFTLLKPNVAILLDQLAERRDEFGWKNITEVVDGAGKRVDFLKAYGSVSAANVTAHVLQYIFQGNRAKQNDYQLYKCLVNSVDGHTGHEMTKLSHRFTHVHPVTVTLSKVSGLSYLAVLLDKATASSGTNGRVLRERIQQSGSHMTSKFKFNVDDYSTYVTDIIKELNANAQSIGDAVDHIFKALLSCPSERYCNYIVDLRRKHDAHPMSPEDILEAAAKEYRSMVINKEWITQSPQQQILALQVQFQQQLAAATAATATTAQGSSSPAPDAPGGSTKKDRKQRLRRGADGRPAFSGDEAWRLLPPTAGDVQVKPWKEQTLKWCAKHGYWCSHSTEECRDKDKPDFKFVKPPRDDASTVSGITASMTCLGIDDVTAADDV